MGISEHLSAELLSEYLRGATSPGVAFAVEAHIELCETCRGEAGPTDHPPVSAEAETRPDRVRRQIDGMQDLPAGGQRSAALGRLQPGPWRRVAPGIRRSRLHGVSGLGEAVFLVSADPGAPLGLPAGVQFLVVLRGAVGSADCVYSRGDFIDLAGGRLQGAGSHETTGCLCLIVGDDDLYDSSLFAFLRRSTRRAAMPQG